jgi:hypothetical protein
MTQLVPSFPVRQRTGQTMLMAANGLLRSVHDKVQKLFPSPRTQHIRTARSRASVYYPASTTLRSAAS